MTASLAWYPAARPAWAQLWREVHRRTGLGPAEAVWPDDFAAHWRDPDLILAMTCSLPMRLALRGHVHIVASPVWDLPGLPAGYYASHLVMRTDDGRDPIDAAAAGIAINAVDSQSGWGAVADAGLTGPAIVTGSHAASMDKVARGEAHLAAIDVVTWALSPYPGLRICATTPPTPAPPFVTARPELVALLFTALTDSIAALSARDRAKMRLVGLVRLPAGSYAAPAPNAPGVQRGTADGSGFGGTGIAFERKLRRK